MIYYQGYNKYQWFSLEVKILITSIPRSSHSNIPGEGAFQKPESCPTWQSAGASEFEPWPAQAAGVHSDSLELWDCSWRDEYRTWAAPEWLSLEKHNNLSVNPLLGVVKIMRRVPFITLTALYWHRASELTASFAKLLWFLQQHGDNSEIEIITCILRVRKQMLGDLDC